MAEDQSRVPQLDPALDSSTRTRDLLDRYLAGDAEAERRMFARLHARLIERAKRSRLMRPVAHAHTPEDVVQMVFESVLKRGMLKHFEDRGRGSLAAEFSKALDNTLIDLARSLGAQKRGGPLARARGASPESSDELEHAASDDTTPTNHARANEIPEIARRVLDPREWEIWKAVDLDGIDQRVLAQNLGITWSALRGVLRRAHLKLIPHIDRERDHTQPRS
ncbi:MAG: sigma-70 family RNA polymerase sigma factor [Planctomycetes bacterium]|nr:sigma-70 family RNA polymerase sigma factor [Planctomycetota bacterium]